MTSPFEPVEQRGGRQQGQVIVIVALALTVLVLFTALAVDVGFWYGERRHMQNAADAGALAGAWELCHGTPANYRAAAESYARMNGATTVEVSDRLNADGTVNANGTTIVVVAKVTAPTFFSRMLLGSVDVSAKAAAACGKALTGCGALPIAFDEPTYTNVIPCSVYDETTKKFTSYKVGSTFILWSEDNASTDVNALCDKCMCGGVDGHLNDLVTSYFTGSTQVTDTNGVTKAWSDWAALPSPPEFIIGGQPMDPGQRGWLRLGLANAPLSGTAQNDNACNNTTNCGSAINCWLKYGFPGHIGIVDPPMCLKGEPGVMDSVLTTAKSVIEGKVSSFVLYNGSCGSANAYNCSSGSGGSLYPVAGLGCGLVNHVFDDKSSNGIVMPNSPGYTCGGACKGQPGCPPCPDCPGWKNDKAHNGERGIMVTKVCECPKGDCVGTGGEPIGEASPGAASLIAVPAGW